jgi:adenylate/nucleoside-diphosphate kinase
MDATRSRWSLKNEAVQRFGDVLKKRQTYISLKSLGKAAPVSDIGIPHTFIHGNQSHFLDYCPVCLSDYGYLYTTTTKNEPTFVAEYRSKFYYMKDKIALELFLKDTERYITKLLPDSLPIKKRKSDLKMFFPKTLSFKGYCPVTFSEGARGFEYIVTGSLDCIVQYKENIFAFRDEDQLQKFMQRPWIYADQKLPTKLPPPIAPIPLSGLPVVGYLEQVTATALTKALINVGTSKPKHPFKSIEHSASQFLSLHLRGNLI